ncbi:hypothetical protein HP507_12150 [Curtobacterium pusillum]|uniref:Acyltransferase n=1 Tax=Curtobacterium pusillum TaxID=69373 RepID=A0ABX2M946_9MICO|nr:hypothetical protein [Curtobacterium pusillum]
MSKYARVAPIILSGIREMRLDAGVTIGPFNVLRNLKRVEMGSNSSVGQWNWISAAPELSTGVGSATLSLGRESALTSRHYIDASGGVVIGKYSTIAGVRTTFITHGIAWGTAEQRARPISVGDYCLIGSNCSIVPGAVVPDRTVVGMGTTVDRMDQSGLVLGSRGTVVKADLSGRYFSRLIGYISAVSSERGDSND